MYARKHTQRYGSLAPFVEASQAIVNSIWARSVDRSQVETQEISELIRDFSKVET